MRTIVHKIVHINHVTHTHKQNSILTIVVSRGQRIRSLKNFMTELKASLWLCMEEARAHWMAVLATGLDRNIVGQRWTILRDKNKFAGYQQFENRLRNCSYQ